MGEEKNLWIVRGVLAAAGLVLLLPAWGQLLSSAGLPMGWSESIGGLLKGVGEAVVVALVLEWLVDARTKRRIVAESIRQVSPRILAHLMPPEMFQYIEDRLLKANLVRRSWNIRYRISVLQDNPEYVKLETESKYEMANTAPTPTTYVSAYEVERSLFAHIGETMINEVTVRNLLREPGHNVLFHYPEETNRPEDRPGVNGDYVLFSKAFEIPVHKQHSAFQFVFTSTEYFHVGSITPFFAEYLVELTTLRVDYPKDILRVIVDLPANKVSELQPSEVDAAGCKFVFPIPILPGQGFTVRFAKVE